MPSPFHLLKKLSLTTMETIGWNGRATRWKEPGSLDCFLEESCFLSGIFISDFVCAKIKLLSCLSRCVILGLFVNSSECYPKWYSLWEPLRKMSSGALHRKIMPFGAQQNWVVVMALDGLWQVNLLFLSLHWNSVRADKQQDLSYLVCTHFGLKWEYAFLMGLFYESAGMVQIEKH